MDINEGKIHLKIPKIQLDSKAAVFYNPIMQLNRDLSVLLLSVKPKKRVLDLLAASGVRGLRIAKEVPGTAVTLNDYKTEKFMNKNAKLNKLNVKIESKPAHVLLAQLASYDYIDIDPFGTPVPFLDSSIKRLAPHGVLGVTATDTSLLCGAYPKACKRVYGAKPLRNEFCKEIGIRIMIRKIQEVAAQYEVALTPIFSHSSNHYMRAYFQKSTGAGKTDQILANFGYILYCPGCLWRDSVKSLNMAPKSCKCKHKLDYAGPLWLGKLWNKKLVNDMYKLSIQKEEIGREARKLLEIIKNEAKSSQIGYFDLHKIAKKNKWKTIPKFDDFLKKNKAVRTHFAEHGFKN